MKVPQINASIRDKMVPHCTAALPQFLFMAPPYERLHAWRECHELALAVHRVTKSFPTDERYGLTSQLRRASLSGSVNIVEGSSRKSRKEFRRFLDISLSSLTERATSLNLPGMISTIVKTVLVS